MQLRMNFVIFTRLKIALTVVKDKCEIIIYNANV